MDHGGPVVHGADTSSSTPRGRLRSGDRQPGVDSSATTRAVTGHSPARGRTARPAARCAHPSRPGTEVPPVAPRPVLHGLLSARTIDCWVPRRRPRGTPPGPPPHQAEPAVGYRLARCQSALPVVGAACLRVGAWFLSGHADGMSGGGAIGLCAGCRARWCGGYCRVGRVALVAVRCRAP